MSDIVVLLIAVFLGSVVSGFAGFAFGGVAGAILLHTFEPLLAIPLMMVCSIICQTTTMVLLRTSVRMQNLTFLIAGGGIGAALGIALLTNLDGVLVRTVFGAILVGYTSYLLWRRVDGACKTVSSRVGEPAVGFFGGLVGAMTAMPGAVPAIWCELRGSRKEQQRAVVQPFILSMQIFALMLLLAKPGGLNPQIGGYVLLSLPALAAGSLAGVALYRRADDRIFRKVVLLLLFASGAAMINWHAFRL